MVKISYVSAAGATNVVDAETGDSVMSAALRNGVSGIIGECGGNNSCATCHIEADLIDMGVSEPRDCSRLGCQIVLEEKLDGLVVDLPPTQP
jgi:2Fe-2S ferredoxin